jgi:hypothetical protein
VAIADRVAPQVPKLRADFCCPPQASLSALLTKPKPTAETASSSLLCDTVVTHSPVEPFVFDINAGHRLVVDHDSLLDTQEVSGSSPLGPTESTSLRLPGGLFSVERLMDGSLVPMGDPACALGITCLSCGRVLEARRDDGRCPHCGEHPDGIVPGPENG